MTVKPEASEPHDPQPLTPEEIRETAERIRRLPKGFLPKDIFEALAEKIVIPTVNLAMLRNNNGRIEVFLMQRPQDDPYWPGQWHITGTVLLSTDEDGSYNSAFHRLFGGEAEGKLAPIGEPRYVNTKFESGARGQEIDQRHYVEVEALSDDLPGQFFPVDELPEGVIEEHGSVAVPEIVAAYLKDKQRDQ